MRFMLGQKAPSLLTAEICHFINLPWWYRAMEPLLYSPTIIFALLQISQNVIFVVRSFFSVILRRTLKYMREHGKTHRSHCNGHSIKIIVTFICCMENTNSNLTMLCHQQTQWWQQLSTDFTVTSSNRNIYALLARCEGNPPVTVGFPSQRPGTQSLMFLWSDPEQTVEHIIETPVIWDAISLIMTSL